ncbi:Bcr/CflA family drug resistance efflux transporter [Pacificimonas flava]|uniref:Bcr/CflA family drug resistance efflux transporter n=2 Tax=Pacificimonas TaxID=1960290 RepID=A0A219B0J8_9SPHN|nr:MULTISPECIES: multidrug effflux MFS transporter [Pacificimonas]MBZ6379699.1 multidrug effflux MFS transporter [Pacificimonas aurantium]OWV31840.1 Bcr/CflA family drug resistance efflux transporter [Pacificimonas flava]
MNPNTDLPPPPRLVGALGTVELVALVAFLMALNALAIDVMLPALHNIAEAFSLPTEGEGANRQQLVIFAYVAGFGAPQIIFGPLSDRFGRKSVLRICLLAYAAVAALCMLAISFPGLLAARFLQGIAAGGIRVIAVSVIRDIHAGRGMARIMSLVMTVFMIVPILAPSIGQLILFVLPWQGTFGILLVAGLGGFLWVERRLPETLPEDRRQPLSIAGSLASYRAVFANPLARGYIVGSGVIFGALFGFIGSSEQVFREVFGQEDTFVLWFAGVALTMSIASLTNSRLVERFGMRRISHAAMFAFIIFSALLLAAMLIFGQKLLIFFPLFALMFASFGFIGANFNAIIMEPLGHIAGTASAAFGFATTTIAAGFGYFIGSHYDGTVIPVITGFLTLGIGTLVIVTITERGHLFRAPSEE